MNLITCILFQGTMAVSFIHGNKIREVGLLLCGNAGKKKSNAKVVADLIKAFDASSGLQKSFLQESKRRASKQELPEDPNLENEAEDDDSELDYNSESGDETVSFSSTACS